MDYFTTKFVQGTNLAVAWWPGEAGAIAPPPPPWGLRMGLPQSTRGDKN